MSDGLKPIGRLMTDPPARVRQAFAVFWDELKRAIWDGPLDELIPDKNDDPLEQRKADVDQSLERFITTGEFDGTGNFHPDHTENPPIDRRTLPRGSGPDVGRPPEGDA